MKKESISGVAQPSPIVEAARPIVETKLLAPSKSAPAAPAEISMRGFVKELRRIDQLPMGQTFVFLLGAGASITSGIDGAATLADLWLKEMHELDPNHNSVPFHQWLHDRRHGIDGLDPKNLAASYSAIFDRRFAANPSQGFAFLTKLMKDAQPGFGYSVLATLLAESKHRAVVTTNFDSLVERALLYYTDHTPLTCTDETGAGAFDKDLSCPLIIKCHRDLHLHPHNGVAETSALHKNFGEALRSLLPGKALIAIGYGGNDPSLMGFLEGLTKEQRPSAVYWCYWGPGGMPGQRILDWVSLCNGRLVAIPGFDELMSGVKGEFGYDLLEEEMEKQHHARVKRYKDQVEQIVNKKVVTATPTAPSVGEGRSSPGVTGTPDTASGTQDKAAVAKNADAVDFASDSITKVPQTGKSRKSAWATILSILPITNPAAKDAAYKKAMADYPGDTTVAEHYADFLRVTFRYADAAAVLDRMIETIEATQPLDDERAASVRARRSHVRWLIGDFVGAEADIQKSITWGEAQSPRNDLVLAIWYATRANTRWQLGPLKEAEEDIAKAISWGEAQTPRDERTLAIDYASRARIRRDRGLLMEAEEDIAKAIGYFESKTPREERELAIWYSVRASIRQDRGLLKEAEEDIAKSIRWDEAQTPRDERSLAVCYALRAGIRHFRGLLKEAEEDITKSITWCEAQTPRDEHGLAMNYATRARIRQDFGLHKEAEEDIAKAITWNEAKMPRNERNLAVCYALRGRIRQFRGLLKEAEEDIAKSITWCEAQTPRDERGLAIRYASRASIRQDTGDLAGAETDIAGSLAWFLAHQPYEHSRIAGALKIQARVFAAIGQWEKAKTSIKESIAEYVEAVGKDHEWTIKAVKAQADIAEKKVPER